jgi:hypothetical protein
VNFTTDLAKRTTMNELCEAWQQTEADIKAAFELLTTAQDRLAQLFDTGQGTHRSFCISSRGDCPDFRDPDAALNRLQRQVWGALTDRLELRKVLSLARIAELDKQIESGKGLPPITYANILAILETNMANAGQYLQEKVFEVYEWLRPGGYSRAKYKTNQKSEQAGVGRKIIKGWCIRRRYNGGYEVNHGSYADQLRALDQVFHLLDGNSPMAGTSWLGELGDAIEGQTNSTQDTFQTAYFKGRCFANGNLHLEFIRADLLEKFNQIAGGYRLQPENKAA